jgi:hypothetical protein
MPAGTVNVAFALYTTTFENPPAGAAPLVHAEPLDVSMFPEVPGATLVTADVPAPTNTAPLVKVAAPVPPWATVRAVVKPVTAEALITPVPEIVTTGVPSLANANVPLVSPAVDIPPAPVVIALKVFAI